MNDREFYEKIFSENPLTTKRFKKYLERTYYGNVIVDVDNLLYHGIANACMIKANFNISYGLFDTFIFNELWFIAEITCPDDNSWIFTIKNLYQKVLFKSKKYEFKWKMKQNLIVKAFELFEQELNKE